MTKREVLKRVRDIVRCLEHQQTLPTETTCSVVAAKKLEMLVKEAPASLVYELSCIHSQLLHSGDDVGTVLNRLKQLLHNEGR
ncbi:MAG TPA: LuxR family transcriptional regulator [Peptococcaceae bacterium]|nr:LuxR family transcriptional regulator [Peptococcaceae bacterium]